MDYFDFSPPVRSTPNPTSRLSLNGNSLILGVSMSNSQTLLHSPLSSISNDAIHLQDLSTVTSTQTSEHFNIDEYFVPNNISQKIMGKKSNPNTYPKPEAR